MGVRNFEIFEDIKSYYYDHMVLKQGLFLLLYASILAINMIWVGNYKMNNRPK